MMDFRHINITIALVSILCGIGSAGAVRFPPPEFESSYEMPGTTTPGPREGIYEYIDTIVLFLALGLSTYLVLKKRSRKAIFALTVFSLIYFGFYREGCICPIGAIQNVTLSFFDPGLPCPGTNCSASIWSTFSRVFIHWRIWAS